ncbi:MAG: DEAD/DEAH box helicase family protein [Solirubrobacterales bacterium]|nr:DEAD/DEAH box helicase family protein [Solirubrobacterales bacterium]MCB8971876.1 DEAD/DEAH box helicase family protein [Thermoleophilales bacterium]MCO5326319.1 DEAD/DEAH box helicase family protein [Solirubrobacterales bacterium]
MADSTALAASAAAAPTGADIERVQKFTREPILLEGESYEDLAEGGARKQAFDSALAEIEEGFEEPSPEWRRTYSLLLGLERVLANDPPELRDGAQLNEHQVDALSGTLAAIIAETEEPGSSKAGPQNGNGGNGAAGDVEDEEEALAEDEEPVDWEDDLVDEDDDDEIVTDAPDDPGANRRFWFEHATGAGKTVAAVGFVEASRTGGILILTHRRNLVDQFISEISTRGYADRLSPPLLKGKDRADGPVTVETYQWFVRNAGKISSAYSIVICDEAHTALGEKTSACIRNWQGPVFIGMTATGALIARHVADLFPTQTSRFDLAQAARRGVIAPLRCIRIPPGPGVRTLANVPLRRGEVDQDFDQEQLAELLDQGPFNIAIADLYRSRFKRVPGIVYTAGVKHAVNVAAAMRDFGINARAVSGETPKRELAETLAAFERGEVDVLCNAMLLAEGWNSPRATICMHLAPTASKRIYQQRVGRVTRRNPGKEAGLVIDLVHPATRNDENIVTLHSLLDRDVYRGGAIVVGPVRRGRGRRVRVEKRVVPVSADPERRMQVLEREMWRTAVERLDYSEQHVWAALAGARVQPNSWRKAKAMLQHDQAKELRRRFLLTCIQRNRSTQLKLKALSELALTKDADAFDEAIDMVGTWQRDQRRAGVKVLLQALAESRIGRRDQAQAWVWRLAEFTRDSHEEYAVARWPETKRLLGLFVNSSGRAHGKNARRLVQAARAQDRRLAVALLAAAVAHTPEAEEVLRGARMRMARKPSAVARELLRNLPKSGGKKRRRRSKRSREGENGSENGKPSKNGADAEVDAVEETDGTEEIEDGEEKIEPIDDPLPGEDADDLDGEGEAAIDPDDIEPSSAPVSKSDHGKPGDRAA